MLMLETIPFKTSGVVVVVGLSLMIGCAAERPPATRIVFEAEPHTTIENGIATRSSWFSLDEIDRLIKSDRAVQASDFEFDRCDRIVFIPKSHEYLARVDYLPRKDREKALSAKVELDGRVTEIKITTLIDCGVRVLPPTTQP